jgi:hypothetical protein
MEKEFKTKDLGITASLMLEGVTLIRTERVDNVCWFVFNDRVTCERLKDKYLFGQLLVPAREYQETVKRLKSLIFTV